MQASDELRATVVALYVGDPIARVDGDLGWTIDRPTLVLPDGSTIRPRVTLVWRREDHGWRVVHSHASIGQAG